MNEHSCIKGETLMKKKKIGHSDMEVFPIGLGTMGMSEFYGETNEAESIATIHKAVDGGVNFFDTADMYGSGHNEILVGKALKGKFDQVVLATKFGILRGPEGEFIGVNGKPEYVRQACEASLKRLGIETIDLYYLHRVDPATPIEETVGAMAELVNEGKVKYLGLSEVKGETLKRANSIHQIQAVQSEYSIWSRDVEEANFEAVRELGISTVAYSPLGRGVLTGRYKKAEDFAGQDYRHRMPRLNDENFETNLKVVNRVEEIAQSKGVKASQVALAWVLAKGDEIIPIPGTKREKYLLENIVALEIKLTDDELNELNKLSDMVAGTRYDERAMALTHQ